MTKTELISAIAEKTGTTKRVISDVLTAFEETVIDTVANGDKVQLTNFVTFQPRHRAERRGRNPQTGEEILIPEAVLPKAKFGKGFKEAVISAHK